MVNKLHKMEIDLHLCSNSNNNNSSNNNSSASDEGLEMRKEVAV
jgi:hypothetical protein